MQTIDLSSRLCGYSHRDIEPALAARSSRVTVEGELVYKWRQSLGLTQQELGDACPTSQTRNRIHDIEAGRGSTSVRTLLNLIHGLGVPGRDDAAKLARFFQGPDRQDVEDAFDRSLEDLLAARASLQSRGRRRVR